MTDRMYCRHCEEQIENCLAAAHDAQNAWMRSYFLTLAGKWTRLARDLEELHSCGSDCPLHKACGIETRPTAEPRPEIRRAAVA